MSFISGKNVLIDQHASTKEEALRIISELSVELGCAPDADEVFAGFLAREQVDQTGLMDGFAIPHCKTDAISCATIIIFRNDQPLEWPSLDGNPVDVAMALLVPAAEAGTTHLRLLAKAAQLLMDEGFKALLRGSDSPSAIADSVNAALEA